MSQIKAIAKKIQNFFLGDKPGFLTVVFPLSLVGFVFPWFVGSGWALHLLFAWAWFIVIFSACRFFVWLRTVPTLWRDLRHTMRQRSAEEMEAATATNMKFLTIALAICGVLFGYSFLENDPVVVLLASALGLALCLLARDRDDFDQNKTWTFRSGPGDVVLRHPPCHLMVLGARFFVLIFSIILAIWGADAVFAGWAAGVFVGFGFFAGNYGRSSEWVNPITYTERKAVR